MATSLNGFKHPEHNSRPSDQTTHSSCCVRNRVSALLSWLALHCSKSVSFQFAFWFYHRDVTGGMPVITCFVCKIVFLPHHPNTWAHLFEERVIAVYRLVLPTSCHRWSAGHIGSFLLTWSPWRSFRCETWWAQLFLGGRGNGRGKTALPRIFIPPLAGGRTFTSETW